MKVSVIVCTYNQLDTIEWAVSSVLSQETDFDFEVIVLDDGTTGFKKIKFPDDERLHVDSNLYNWGMMHNYAYAFELVQDRDSKYIAFNDGDDYWIDNKKLQKQVDYMDANLDCGLCITKGLISEKGVELLPLNQENPISFDGLLKGTDTIFAQTYLLRASTFYKHIDFDKFLRMGFHTWDLPIVLELIKHTKFHRLPDVTAVFVKQEESTTMTRKRSRRIRWIFGTFRIRMYYIFQYGCKPSTLVYLVYKFTRSIYSIIFKRW